MRVGVAQLAATADKPENQKRITRLAEAGADQGVGLLVFPECAMADLGDVGGGLRDVAEPLDGPFVDALARLAARLDVTIVAGMYEGGPDDDLVHNTAVAVDPRAGRIAAYRKRHLYDAFGWRESDEVRAGVEDPPIFALGDLRVAIAICYDIRFPGYVGSVADRGADLLLVPAAWVAGPMKAEHWTVMVQARAVENTMYVAGAAQPAPAYCGRSMLVDPLGVTSALEAAGEGVAVMDVTRDRLAAARAQLPVLEQRRARDDAPVREGRARLRA